MQAKHLTSIGLNLMTYKKSFEYDSIRESSVDIGTLTYVANFNYKFALITNQVFLTKLVKIGCVHLSGV